MERNYSPKGSNKQGRDPTERPREMPASMEANHFFWVVVVDLVTGPTRVPATAKDVVWFAATL